MGSDNNGTGSEHKTSQQDFTFDRGEVERFLELIGQNKTDSWSFQTFSDIDAKDRSVVRTICGSFKDKADYLEMLALRGSGIFVTPNEFRDGRRRKSTLVSLRSFYADFDSGAHSLKTLLAQSPIEPTFVVESSPMKFHFYWVLLRPVDEDRADAYTNIQNGIIQAFADFGIDKLKDTARVLRVPGTWHQKREPFRTTIVHESEIYYDWDHVEESFPYDSSFVKPDVEKVGEEYKQKVDNIKEFWASWMHKEAQAIIDAAEGDRHYTLKRILVSLHHIKTTPAILNGACEFLLRAWEEKKPGATAEFYAVREWCERNVEQDIELVEKYERTVPLDQLVSGSTTTPTKHKDLPFDIQPPGLVGDIVRYIEQRAYRKQPILSFAAALTFVGMLFSRRWVHCDLKTRTHLYTIGVAVTGGGKDTARVALQSIVMDPDLDLPDLCQLADVASAPGLFEDLAAHPVQLLCLDEFHSFVDKITSSASASWQKDVKTDLMKYFGSSGSKLAPPKRRKGKDAVTDLYVVCPALSVYGTSTPKLYNSLKSGDVMDGFLNRFLVFESDVCPRQEDAIGSTTPKASLIRAVKTALKSGPNNYYDTVLGGFDVDGTTVPNSQLMRTDTECGQVRETDQAKELRKKYSHLIDDRANSSRVRDVWARTNEHMIKLMMIHRLSQLEEVAIVQVEDVEWAYKVVIYCTEQMEKLALENIAENPFDARFKFLLTRIAKHKVMKASDWRQPRHTQDGQIIKQMIDEGMVVQSKTEGGRGRPAIVYEYTGG